MYDQRLHRLQAELRARKVNCLALIAGSNLRYMTGLDFHLMERPVTVFFPAEGKPVFAVPSLEAIRVQQADPYDREVFTYDDVEGPAACYERAMRALPEVERIAVEYLRMRVLELRLVQRHVPSAAMEDAGPIMDTLRLTKSAGEVAAMRRAVEISEAALAAVLELLEPGMTERQLANRLLVEQLERGGEALPFEPIVLIGPNAALPHGAPTDRALQSGDVLLLDFGTTCQGYVSDITRTFVFDAQPTERQRQVYEAVKAANAAGRAAARPGVPCQEVDRAARAVIEAAGFGPYFTHRVGHGIGLEGHEGPYMREGNDQLLEAGMCFTVEPGIYLPGELGVRIEDNLVITEDGAESLTTFDRDLRVVG